MKKIKFALVAFVAVATVIGTFAFTSKNSKGVTSVDYKYDPSSLKREIAASGSLALVPTEMVTDGNWVSGAPTGLTYSATAPYLRFISFTEEFDTDGGNDGELTKQEAINAVEAYFSSHSQTLPNDGQAVVVGSANIIIKRATTN